jgi:hypothetical protein
MLLDEIGAFLEAAGIGAVGQVIFLGGIPVAANDQAVILRETSGFRPDFIHNQTGVAIDKPSLQVTVRDRHFEQARLRIKTVAETLTAVANQTISGTRYLRIAPAQSSPIDLGPDENNRHRLVMNFDVMKDP